MGYHPMYDYMRVDAEPKLLQITSEPYVIFTKRGYQPVVNVLEKKRKMNLILFISPVTLTRQLEPLREENNGQFIGLEFWIRKESYEKTSSYILEPF